MKPIYVVSAILLALLISIPSCGKAEPSEDASVGALAGRDFVLVVADSFHAKHASAYGYERPTTPYLERLAAQGVRAERTLSQTSWTLSSVVSLFTGLVQEAHGVLNADQVLGEDGPRTLAEMFRDAGYRTVGLVENGVVAPHTGLGRGFDRYEYVRFMGPDGDQETLRRAREVLEQTGDGRPVFLYVHLLPPHMPYQPPAPFAGRFEAEGNLSDIDGSTGAVSRVQLEGLGLDHPDVLRLVEQYDAHIAYADDRIRRLTEPWLLGARASETAVLVTSDHGEGFMQHGRTGHNACVYEEMVHVPWIFVAPDAVDGGRVISGPTSLLDSVPTLAELFDLGLPSAELGGESLVPRLDGSPRAEPRTLYLSSRYPGNGKAAQFAWVDGPWKFVTRRRDRTPRLFDLREDPLESEDVTDAQPDRAAAMATELAQMRARLARIHRDALTAPLEKTMVRDLESLGYGGANFDVLDSSGGK